MLRTTLRPFLLCFKRQRRCASLPAENWSLASKYYCSALLCWPTHSRWRLIQKRPSWFPSLDRRKTQNLKMTVMMTILECQDSSKRTLNVKRYIYSTSHTPGCYSDDDDFGMPGLI